MSINRYADNLWSELEAAWDLCVGANSYSESIRSDAEKIWSVYFCKSPAVDLSKPLSQSNSMRLEVFCKNRYGLYFNEKINSWVPFRHGDIDLKKL
jgi:hypothetical protein